MTPSPRYDLDHLIERARAMEPTPLSDLEARRMVRAALSAPAPTRRPRSPLRWLALAAALVPCMWWAVHGLWSHGTTLSVDAADPPLRIALLAGDALTVAPGAELELLSQTTRERRVRVGTGAVLFDVKKLRPGEDFAVLARDAEVHVVGTVFSVEVTPEETLVRVYEGRVRLPHTQLGAGSTWSSRRGSTPGPDRLASEAHAAAQARSPGTAGKAGSGEAATHAQDHEDRSREADVDLRSREADVDLRSREADVDLRSREADVELRSREAATKATVQALPAPETPPAPVQAPTAPDGADSKLPPMAPQTAALPAPVQAPNLPNARRALAEGRADSALGDAQRALTDPRQPELEWRELEAHALRALGRFNTAVISYERAAQLAEPRQRPPLAYAAAALCFEGLRDPLRTLVLLDRFELDAYASPLRERASRLRVHSLLALRRMDEARRAAERYLALEPETAVSEDMRRLLGW
ncbi:MAG: FecR domain-containing protein [Myxococcales bacterium]